jgi:hypothetical protein
MAFTFVGFLQRPLHRGLVGWKEPLLALVFRDNYIIVNTPTRQRPLVHCTIAAVEDRRKRDPKHDGPAYFFGARPSM